MRLSLLLAAAMFLAAPAIAQQSNAPLNLEQQAALRGSILSATQAADFKRSKQILEVYRTLRAAGVTLTSAEAFDMGECARARGLSGEAADAFALLKSDDLEYRENGALLWTPAPVQDVSQKNLARSRGAAICPASVAASRSPRARMGVRRSGPNQNRVLCARRAPLVFLTSSHRPLRHTLL